MLKLKNVSKYYYQDGVIAEGFTKVNLELHLGEFVVITGESGSGKSTLLNVLSGLDTYEDGEMYINGEETSHYREEDYLEYRRKYVSNIFQNFNLVNSYTVEQNIELAMLTNGKTKREVKKEVNELIDKVGLKKYKKTLASKLSGGQKQRVAIARALANSTPIIVADEPTGSLDSKAASSIIKLLSEISHNKLVIVVTHQKKEIENYATRLIRMHDGKLLENKVIKKVNLDDEVKPKKINDIKLSSMIRLGIRNAFNIPIKFILMFVIFLLITVTLITNYASFKMAEYEEIDGSYNQYFTDTSDKRIIISKKNNEIFNSEDYSKIENIEGVDYLVKQDLINDYYMYLSSDNFYFSGTIMTKKIDKVDIGVMPKEKDEIVIIGNKDNWYLSSMSEDILKSTYRLENESTNRNLKIVGIIYDNDLLNYEYKLYLNDELKEEITSSLNHVSANIEFKLNNNYFGNKNGNYLDILVSNKVSDGKIYVKDNMNIYCKDYNCKNNILNITIDNLYYKDSDVLTIDEIITKDNANKLVDMNYDNINDVIFMSENDYNKLFNRGNYQSSIYIKDVRLLDDVDKKLDELDINYLNLRDAKYSEVEMVLQIIKIFKLVVVIVLVVTLFFISYFIMKIIYKSRNSYYVTLRSLGSTKKVCINILMNELICLASITYLCFLIFIRLVSKDIINFEYFKTLIPYVSFKEYLIVYLILLILSILMSYRYGRKIFKNSIMKNYGERI